MDNHLFMKTIDDAADMTDRLFDNFERAETTDEDRFVTVLISKPGVGKSSVVARKARERGYDLIDLNLACIEPTDIIGLGARERRDDGTWMTVPALPSWANLALRGHTIILRG